MAAGFVGRLPISMITLGVVLLVTASGGNYALAGGMSASFALAAAFVGPLGARWIDRRGQDRVVPILATAEVAFLLLFTWAVWQSAPIPLQFATLVGAGAVAPNVGSLVRARWAASIREERSLRSAFALEAVVDELVFIVGPPLVTIVALSVNEVAGLILCGILLATGAWWLATQRATQPPVRFPEAGGSHPAMLGAGLVVVTALMLLLGGVFGAFEVTTVAFTKTLGHEELTGLVLALYAVGSLISGLVYGARPHTRSVARQLLIATAVLALVTAPLPFVGSLPLLMAAAFLSGLSVSPVLILAIAAVERLVPAARLTEALTVNTSGLAVGLAVGSPLSGALIDRFGASSGYLVMAGCGAATVILAGATHGILARQLASP